MTKTKTEFNELKDAIFQAAKEFGVSEHALYDNLGDWNINYEINLDRDFKYIISKLNEETRLFKQAIQRKDMKTASFALVGIKFQSHTLLNFIENIDDDVRRLGWGEELKEKWPDFSEDYQVPADYNYENTNLPYEESKKHLAAFNAEEDRLDALEQCSEPKVLRLHKKESSD